MVARVCLYCAGELVKDPTHPTWHICPRCEPKRVVKLPEVQLTIDRRGEPSRPGRQENIYGSTVSAVA